MSHSLKSFSHGHFEQQDAPFTIKASVKVLLKLGEVFRAICKKSSRKKSNVSLSESVSKKISANGVRILH